jgi:hypothetical protein
MHICISSSHRSPKSVVACRRSAAVLRADQGGSKKVQSGRTHPSDRRDGGNHATVFAFKARLRRASGKTREPVFSWVPRSPFMRQKVATNPVLLFYSGTGNTDSFSANELRGAGPRVFTGADCSSSKTDWEIDCKVSDGMARVRQFHSQGAQFQSVRGRHDGLLK